MRHGTDRRAFGLRTLSQRGSFVEETETPGKVNNGVLRTRSGRKKKTPILLGKVIQKFFCRTYCNLYCFLQAIFITRVSSSFGQCLRRTKVFVLQCINYNIVRVSRVITHFMAIHAVSFDVQGQLLKSECLWRVYCLSACSIITCCH